MYKVYCDPFHDRLGKYPPAICMAKELNCRSFSTLSLFNWLFVCDDAGGPCAVCTQPNSQAYGTIQYHTSVSPYIYALPARSMIKIEARIGERMRDNDARIHADTVCLKGELVTFCGRGVMYVYRP